MASGTSRAYSSNNNGQIAGVAEDSSGNGHATLFDPTGGGNNIDLGTLAGGYSSRVLFINDNGQLVGEADTYGSPYGGRATLFDPTGAGKNINLGTLGGDRAMSTAFSINNNGQIVGRAYNRSIGVRATLFDPTGAGNNIDLNSLIDPSSGWVLTVAYRMTDDGVILGWGINPEGYQRACLLKPIPEPATLSLLSLGGLAVLRQRRRQ